MTEKKNDAEKRQTKAGMMEKNGNVSGRKKDNTTSAKDPANTPKISKEKAEGNHEDKPVH
jgi:hypothetical protein